MIRPNFQIKPFKYTKSLLKARLQTVNILHLNLSINYEVIR